MTTLFVALVLAFYAVWLPGALFTRLALPASEPFTGHVLAAALGFYVMPVLAFGAAMVLGTVVSVPLVLGVATALNGALGALLVRRTRRARRGASGPAPSAGDAPR